MRQVISIVVLHAVLCFGTSTFAGEVVFKDLKGRTFIEPRQQIGFSVGYRTDETKYTNAHLTFTGQFLHFVTQHFALKADLGYTHRTTFGRSWARTISYGAGFRLQQPEKVITPWIELGLAIHRHTGELGDNDYGETRYGPQGGIGLSFKLSKVTRVDIGIQHVVNAVTEIQTVYSPGPLPPDPPDPVNLWSCGGGSASADEVYNPTHVFVRYRFGL